MVSPKMRWYYMNSVVSAVLRHDAFYGFLQMEVYTPAKSWTRKKEKKKRRKREEKRRRRIRRRKKEREKDEVIRIYTREYSRNTNRGAMVGDWRQGIATPLFSATCVFTGKHFQYHDLPRDSSRMSGVILCIQRGSPPRRTPP
jgi:hypothetical protein